MADFDYLRGRVTAHLDGGEKGLVEVALGGYDQERDKIHARVVQSMSGVYWLPEIGDVVEAAVPRVPGYEAHILRVHRPADDEQTQACWTEKNDVKQFRTRSGHTVTLSDAQDGALISIRTAGGLECRLEDGPQSVTVKKREAPEQEYHDEIEAGHVIRTDPAAGTILKEGDTVTLSAGKGISIRCGGASLEIDSGGGVAIRAKGALDLSGREITLSAQGSLTAKGRQLALSGGMTAELSGQTRLQLSSSGITEVKGGVIKLN